MLINNARPSIWSQYVDSYNTGSHNTSTVDSNNTLEHCTGIAEVMGSNPVESPEFFRFMRQLLKIVQQVQSKLIFLD